MKQLIILMMIFLPCLLIGQVGITFTFGDGTITNESGTSYYEFDVYAQASASGTRLGTGIVLINYNEAAFGPQIKTNNKVSVVPGVLTSSPYPFPLYELIMNDNANTRLAITFYLPSTYNGFGNALPTSPTTLAHVKIEIATIGENSNLSFQDDLMYDQQYYDDNATKYNPVEAVDTLDETLPVELSSFTAVMNNSHTGVNLTWVTHSESNLVGYGIYRGESSEFSEASNLNAFIGATNTSQTQIYMFSDCEVFPETTYWYWLESMEMNGINEYFGPIYVTIPQTPIQTPQIPMTTNLVSLYPNPFNPDLTIDYSLDRTSTVNIVVTNVKGQVVKTLVNESKAPGLHSYRWDGKDSLGNSCASGMYLIRMLANDKSVSRKVMLMK